MLWAKKDGLNYTAQKNIVVFNVGNWKKKIDRTREIK